MWAVCSTVATPEPPPEIADSDGILLEVHSRNQHAASLEWPARDRLDTTGLIVEESLAKLREMTGT